ncbi:MAG: DUF6261 family protein [Mariniphaga sp.]
MNRLISNCRITETDAVAARIGGAYEHTGPESDTRLNEMITTLREKRARLLEAIKRAKAESDLEEKDEVRDNGLRSLVYLVQGFTHHPDPAVKAAALKVDDVLDRYGLSVTNESYSTESSLINSLLADLSKAKMQEPVAALSGCTELIAVLHTAQEAFEQARIAYEEEKAQEGAEANATTLKKEVIDVINNRLMVYLDAMMLVDETTYGAFGRTVAEIIDETNEMVKKRRKKPEPAE